MSESMDIPLLKQLEPCAPTSTVERFSCKIFVEKLPSNEKLMPTHATIIVDNSSDELNMKVLVSNEEKVAFKGYPGKPFKGQRQDMLSFSFKAGALRQVRIAQTLENLEVLYSIVYSKYESGKKLRVPEEPITLKRSLAGTDTASQSNSRLKTDLEQTCLLKEETVVSVVKSEAKVPRTPLKQIEGLPMLSSLVNTGRTRNTGKTGTDKNFPEEPSSTPVKKNPFGPIKFQYTTQSSPIHKHSSTTIQATAMSTPRTTPNSSQVKAFDVDALLLSSPCKEESEEKTRNGFKNIGQTCYIASTLQLLFNTATFRKKILSLNKDTLTNTVVLQQLYLLFKAKDQDNVVDPSAFKAAIGAKCSRFAGNQQEDAHEFLQELFGQLDTEMNQYEASLLDCFEWTLLNTISCTGCSYESSKQDTCRDISVDFPCLQKENNDNSLIDLSYLLQSFFKSENVEYKCEKCSSTTATIKHEIKSSPQVMIIHLKRFAVDYESLSPIKRQDCVKVGTLLDLNTWCLDKGDALSSEFQLRCVVNHLGQTHNKGHYIADVLDPSLKKWRTYDDSVMIKQDIDMSVVREQTCYLLAYVNTDI